MTHLIPNAVFKLFLLLVININSFHVQLSCRGFLDWGRSNFQLDSFASIVTTVLPVNTWLLAFKGLDVISTISRGKTDAMTYLFSWINIITCICNGCMYILVQYHVNTTNTFRWVMIKKKYDISLFSSSLSLYRPIMLRSTWCRSD